ncbi:MAG: YdiU family protein [Ahniella sp.]|nr:YdiU family protein [Ahniella sp.]
MSQAPFRFEHPFLDLPVDPVTSSHTRQVTGALSSQVLPTPVAAPRLLAQAFEVAALLGFEDSLVHSDEFLQAFAGNRLWPQMQALASNYGGHQFGHWAGQLGDGRAIHLGALVGSDGRHFELQLKGAGPTPYSRGSDGRAVLRSSLREFLCSEAMAHLGIPTTRALCLIGTGEPVIRDMLYDGHPEAEPGAIVCRVASSFLRFGHFELPARRGDVVLLQQLVDAAITREFQHVLTLPEAERIPAWFTEVAERTAEMVAHWMRVGFVHGVMNTDNMSILGLTIDYGPYGWLEEVDPSWTPNTTDAMGRRYCYGRQPEIAHWNLYCLAQALAQLMDDPEPLQAGLRRYAEVFTARHREFSLGKLGLPSAENRDDWLSELFGLLRASAIDFTRFFRSLGELDIDRAGTDEGYWIGFLTPNSYEPDTVPATWSGWQPWLQRYALLRRAEDPEVVRSRLVRHNPKFVFRNYLAQQAIDAAAAGDLSVLERLHEVLRRPYDDQPDAEAFAAMRPDWARRKPGCSMLSCSS